MIQLSLNLDKIPKDKIYQGKNARYLFVTVAERKEPDNYGNTHSVYIYNKDTKEKTYIGDGKEEKWNGQQTAKKDAWDGKQQAKMDDLPF